MKPPSEREIVNYIRNHTPDIQQLIKHFKKVSLVLSSRLLRSICFSFRTRPDLFLLFSFSSLLLSQSLKSTNPDVTASNKAALIEVTKRVATFAGGVITLKAEHA